MMDALPDDFRDMLVELADAGARFMVVGGYAVAYHGHPRATKDIDIWVDPTPANAPKVFEAIAKFGAPIAQLGITEADLQSYDGVIQLGVPPVRIDLLCRIDGVGFEQAWDERDVVTIEGRRVGIIGLERLLQNKRASGRTQDLADVEVLERAARDGRP